MGDDLARARAVRGLAVLARLASRHVLQNLLHHPAVHHPAVELVLALVALLGTEVEAFFARGTQSTPWRLAPVGPLLKNSKICS